MATTTDLKTLSLRQLGDLISTDWTKPYFGAVPYIEAMRQSEPDGSYGLDDQECLVMYFLSNATAWRGEVARAVKAELKRRLKS